MYSLEIFIQIGISFPFVLCLSLILFQLFVRPPQTTSLPFRFSFSWGWPWSLPPVQCLETPSIVLQALCLSDQIPSGSVVGFMANPFQRPFPVVSPCWPMPPTLAGSFGSVSYGVTALWVLLPVEFCVCPPRLKSNSLFPPVLWKSYNQIPLALKARFPGDSQAFSGSSGWETWLGVQNLHSGARTLILLFSSLWVTHLVGMGFDFFMIASPLTVSLWLLLCFWTWGIFFCWVPVSSCLWLFNS